MLYLNSNEEKILTFEVDINGVGCDDLCGSVRFIHEGVEYGFPIEVENNQITSIIKPLDSLIDNIKNGTILPTRLEMNSKEYFFSPWHGEFKVQSPVTVEAQLKEDDKEIGVSVKAKVVESKKPAKAGSPIVAEAAKETVTEDLSDLKTDERENDTTYKKDLAELVKTTIQQMGLAPVEKTPETLMEKGGTKGNKIIEELDKQQKENEKDFMMKKLKNITREGVYQYMHNAGTKNSKIKELVYEQAVAAAGSGEPFKVLKQVVKILKKRK